MSVKVFSFHHVNKLTKTKGSQVKALKEKTSLRQILEGKFGFFFQKLSHIVFPSFPWYVFTSNFVWSAIFHFPNIAPLIITSALTYVFTTFAIFWMASFCEMNFIFWYKMDSMTRSTESFIADTHITWRDNSTPGT